MKLRTHLTKSAEVEMACSGDIEGIACSAIRPEIEYLKTTGMIRFPVTYLNSEWHMRPSALQHTLQKSIDTALVSGARVVLFYGDCHFGMSRHHANPRVARLAALNCGAMLLGRPLYKELMRKRALLVFSEWAARWPDICESLDEECGAHGMVILKEMHDKLVYLDTGVRPVPERELTEFSSFTGLPAEILPVSLYVFQSLIVDCLDRLARTSDGAGEMERP